MSIFPGEIPRLRDLDEPPDELKVNSSGPLACNGEPMKEISKVVEEPKAYSFKDKLLGSKGGLEEVEVEVLGEEDDEELVENRWYKYQEEEEGDSGKNDVYDPCPEIKVTDEELDNWSKPWKGALVVSLLGKKVSYRVLENKLNRDWARKGSLKITDMPRDFYDFYVVQFTSSEDYRHALFNGPWMLADHYLMVHRWRPFFITNTAVESKVAVWVRVSELTLELYNDRFLWRVGKKLGSLLKIDRLTSIHSRGQFARICVEIDLSKKLVPSIVVRGVVLHLEYEGLHIVCFACGKYGHKQDCCPELQMKSQTVEEKERRDGEEPMQGVGSMADQREGTPKGNEGKVTDTEKLTIHENRSLVDQIKSNRYNWLTVKKVKRSNLANVRAGLGSKGPYHNSSFSRNERPKEQTNNGSRFSLLDEERVLLSLEKPKEMDLAIVNKEAVGSGSGPSLSTVGQINSEATVRVRNRRGGKNPQGPNKGKENKSIKRSLGPKMKQFSAKSPRVPLGSLEDQNKGKGISQKANQHVVSTWPLLKDTKEMYTAIYGRKEEPSTSLKGGCGTRNMDRTRANWDMDDELEDAEIIRELHLGLKSFCPDLDPGGGGTKAVQALSRDVVAKKQPILQLVNEGNTGGNNGDGNPGLVSTQISNGCR